MGIFINAITIIFGGLFGGKLLKNNSFKKHRILAIGIMIVSLVGFLENVYNIQGKNLASENLLIVLLSFFIGSKIGELLQIEEKLSNFSKTSNNSFNAIVDTTLFFGVGGLQISGPILLALNNDNTQLFIKSFVDFPFAIAFGATYGKKVSFASLPVATVQILIFLAASSFSTFLSDEMTAQLCAMGYIILFFSGFNLITESNNKINNINMLPSVFFVVALNLIKGIMEGIL